MFHPSTNRLAAWFEISAMSIALAPSGGSQLKADYVQVESVGKGSNFGRRSATWAERRQVRWAAVRESYLVVIDEPGQVRHLFGSTCLSSLSLLPIDGYLGCLPVGL